MYQDNEIHNIRVGNEPSEAFKRQFGIYVNKLPRAYRFLAATEGLVLRPVRNLCAFCRDQASRGIEEEESCLGHMGIQTYDSLDPAEVIQKKCDSLNQRSFRKIARELVGHRDGYVQTIFPIILIPEYVCLYSEENPIPCGNQDVSNSIFWQRQDLFGEVFYHEFWHFIDEAIANKVSSSPAFIRVLQKDLNRRETAKFFPSDCEEFDHFLDFSAEVFADAGSFVYKPEEAVAEDTYLDYFPSTKQWVQQFDNNFRLALSSGYPQRIQRFMEQTLGSDLPAPK